MACFTRMTLCYLLSHLVVFNDNWTGYSLSRQVGVGSINVSKTVGMFVKNNKSEGYNAPQIYYNRATLAYVDVFKYVGVLSSNDGSLNILPSSRRGSNLKLEKRDVCLYVQGESDVSQYEYYIALCI